MPARLKYTVWLLLAGLASACWAEGTAPLRQPVLRAAYIASNTAQAVQDSDGKARGVAADITRELATRLQVPVQIVALPAAADVINAVRSGAADIGFVAPNPARMVLGYSQTYMLVQQSFLVAANSALMRASELDRPGSRLGVNTGDSVGVYLKANFIGAQINESPDYSMMEAAKWLSEGKVDAFAGNRPRLRLAAAHRTDLRLLDDNLYGVPQAIAVALDNPALLAYINNALDDMRASGFLANAVRQHGAEGTSVAPAAPR